jgi:phosphoribosyl-ATP pyrophosphohydrolase
MAFDFFQQFNPNSDKKIVEESKEHHLSKMKEFSGELESNIQDWYEDQMASSLFQQFNPKSVKEILEETKEYQLSKMKDFSEELESNIQDWYADRIEYLRANHSSQEILRGDQDWNPSGAGFNNMGNEILFYDVEGGDGHNHIDMNTRTHDEINGGKGYDVIEAGWGNDIIWGGQNSGHVFPDIDEMYGEAGNDIITAHSYDIADGGEGRDQLIGYSGSYLTGGSESDIFTINTGNVGEGNDLPVNIDDFSKEDKLIINFRGNNRSGFQRANVESAYVGEYNVGDHLFVFDGSGAVVAEINPVDLNDFAMDISSDRMMMTLTGSEFM